MTELRDWENPLVTQINRQPTHAPLGAYPDAEMALACNRKVSPYVRLLNGKWKFHLAPSPAGVPEGFYRPDYDSSNWAEITVPGNWQLQGFDDIPIYTNVHSHFRQTHPSCRKRTPPAATSAHFPSTPAGKNGISSCCSSRSIRLFMCG